MGIEADAAYNTRLGKVETANADFYITKNNLRLGVGQRYVLEESSQTTFEVRWKINEEWELKVYDRYEFETNRSKEFEATVSKVFSCVIVDFTYNHKEKSGDTFYVVCRLKGYPNVSFDMSQSYHNTRTQTPETQRTFF